MIEKGMNPRKLVLGMPLYGRTFILPEGTGFGEQSPTLGTVAKSTGFQGPYTREDGFMGYNEVINLLLSNVYILLSSF